MYSALALILLLERVVMQVAALIRAEALITPACDSGMALQTCLFVCHRLVVLLPVYKRIYPRNNTATG